MAAALAAWYVSAEPVPDTPAWGATDPTWSPDGREIAFSLFGSIWKVAASGGVAQQLTSGPGYHAHPAWSPRGHALAYVVGTAPTGRMPNISGTIEVLHLDSGREEKIQTELSTAGTLAWSPDGTRIVCGLRRGNSGALLHEITIADGKSEPIQVMPVRKDVANWIDASYARDAREIVFGTSRGGSPQIWSLLTGRPVVQIQLPLTTYRAEDVVLLQGVSTAPDGSVVYSADVVNGRGQYSLYRVQKGSKPQRVTNGGREQFSPAVSPDGKQIAYVSNQLGNVDLFLAPGKHVRIDSLKFRGPSGFVRLRVVDEQGAVTQARVHVRASDGKAYAPQGQMLYYIRDGFFLSNGDDTFPAPAGTLRFTAVKGIEYEQTQRTVDVPAGGTAEVTIQLQRWTNWMQRGWYTGENHFHANYNGIYYQRPSDSLRWLKAEDLNVANMMVANSEGEYIHDKEFFTGAPSALSGPRYVLYWGQEYRNDYVLGHLAFLNIKRQAAPSFTSIVGTVSPYDFPLNTTAALKVKEQGGFVSVVHPHYQGFTDVFATWWGAKELPVTAAFGAVDSMDLLPSGEPTYEIWYSLLNSGFHIPAGAGTDCFTNYRGLHRVPGAGRIYIDVGPTLSWERWLQRYREGRTFVTTGPLLTMNVNGEAPGAKIRIPAGQPYRARISAEAVAQAPLRRIELIRDGKVVASVAAASHQKRIRLEETVEVERSSWFAVRATGDPSPGLGAHDTIARAHTSPVYVEVNGQPALHKQDLEIMTRWIDRLQALLEERHNYGSAANRDRALQMLHQARAYYTGRMDGAQ